MSPKIRAVVFVISAIATFVVLVDASLGLDHFGSFTGAYSSMLLSVATKERHVLNVPSAVNFDYRGFDTLGEEYIFFAAVLGVLLIFGALHGSSTEHAGPMETREMPRETSAVVWIVAGLLPFLAAMAMDIGAHGQLTPGGGFQGGAVFASAVACIYLGLGLPAMFRVVREHFVDVLESLGALSFVGIGVGTLIATGAFLKNALPLGKTGETVSGGTIYVLSCAVFLEIACGLALLLVTFLKQMRKQGEDQQ